MATGLRGSYLLERREQQGANSDNNRCFIDMAQAVTINQTIEVQMPKILSLERPMLEKESSMCRTGLLLEGLDQMAP